MNLTSPSAAPDADALFERAELLISLGRNQEAVPLLHGVLALRPGDLKTLANLGWAYRASGNAAEGQRHLLLALDIAAVSMDDLLLRTWVLQTLGRHREALSYAEAAYRTDPESDGALYNLALRQLDCGKITLARTSARRLASLYPDFKGAYQLLALISERKHQWSEAEQWCDEVLRCDPEDADFQALRGKVLFRQGRQGESIAALWSAAKQAPDSLYARVSLDTAINWILLPPIKMVLLTLFLSSVGLEFYLLLVVSGFPPWMCLLIAGISFIATCPLSCWADDGKVHQVMRAAYERLPLEVQQYCALGGYKGTRSLLSLFVFAASVLPLCVMVFWTIFGEPTHLWAKHIVGNLLFAVEIVQLFSLFGLPYLAVFVRKKWSATFNMADNDAEETLSDEETEAVGLVAETVPQNKPALKRVDLMKKRLAEENGY